ncbi:hypothetical protein Aperf_G00000061532 [Anoplocephala perfoliata]
MLKKTNKKKTDEEKAAQLKKQQLAAAATAKKKNELLQRYLKRLEKMAYSFETELSMMKREYEAEKAYMVNRHRQRIDELKNTYVAFDRYFLQKEQIARNEYGSIRDEMKNRAIEDKHALRIKLEKKVESIWAEFNSVKANYIKATEERRAYYEVLRKRNDQALKDIEFQTSHLQAVTNKIVVVKTRVNKMQEEFKEKNRLLGEERDRLSNHLLGLKKKINGLRDRQRRKLTETVNVSNQVQKVLTEMVKEANTIIELGELCRQLECEEEKVLPFYTSSLTPEDERLLAEDKDTEENEELKSMLKVYEPLDLFWHRFNKVQLDKLALLKERQILEVENRHLKALVTKYLESLSVNDKVMSEPNTLLIINSKHNLIIDPAIKDGKRRPVGPIKVDGTLMAKDGVVSRLKIK